MKKILSAGLVLIFGTIGSAQPQHLDKSTGTEVAVSRIDSIFSDFNRDDAPGCAVGVFWEGGIIFSKEYGMASLEHNIGLSPKSILNLGSESKQFTALSFSCWLKRAGFQSTTSLENIYLSFRNISTLSLCALVSLCFISHNESIAN